MPAAVFGWFPAGSDGDTVVVFDADGVTERERFRFPRQSDRTKLCLADYLAPLVDGRPTDVLGVSAVTVGRKASERTAELFAANRYQDYLYAHGLAVELAEATAEYVHATMRADWGIAGDESPAIGDLIKQRYRGRRYSPGYPACPDLGQQEGLFRLLGAERIGLSLTEGHQIEPEQSTSAFVFHHPQATYFST
jgi:5-methyltetrahydrofolate--homocysteine methyltransferase